MPQPEGTPNLQGIEDSLKTGIGRPVSQEWMEEFQVVFERKAPDDVIFYPRSVPGIQYVPAKRLGSLIAEEYRGEETEEIAKSQAGWLIRDLIDKGKLLKLEAESQSEFPFRLVRFNWDKSNPKLELLLNDIDENNYPERYLCQGEREVFKKRLDINDKGFNPRTHAVPTLNIALGMVTGTIDKEMSGTMIDDISKKLPIRVNLLGVGVTRL